MYVPFFGLAQAPFSIAPDPRFLFMSERHREALAHLVYGVQGGGGFVLLSGEIGAGKTTVVRCFLEQIPPDCNVAYIFNPKLSAAELVKSVCDEFGVAVHARGPAPPSIKECVDPLNRFLLDSHAAGRSNVLVIDEAQMLAPDVLEQLRLLTNLETDRKKLLQIILIGQPELRDMLAGPGLEQLAQRVIARFHLGALTPAETVQYVAHRLAVAGLSRPSPFQPRALRLVHRISRGVPRRINLLCDRALLGAYASNSSSVTPGIVERAAGEVFDRRPFGAARRASVRVAGWVALATLAGVGIGVAFGLGGARESAGVARAPALAASGTAVASAGPATASAARPSAPAGSVAARIAATPASGAGPLVGLADESTAWRQLAAVWKVALAEGDPCVAAAAQQLQCFRGAGGLAVLRQLDRPAILTLHDGRGRITHALLTGLTDQTASVGTGAAAQTVALAELLRAWRGEFATYWRAPPGYAGRVVDGRAHPSAGWVEQRIAAWQGTAVAAPADATDERLRAQVQAFQVAQGLKADGLAGPTTLMQLNRAAGIAEPRLDSGAPAH
ncbi:MAG: AAA family ATPase [Burkholderiaceae bacterium]